MKLPLEIEMMDVVVGGESSHLINDHAHQWRLFLDDLLPASNSLSVTTYLFGPTL